VLKAHDEPAQFYLGRCYAAFRRATFFADKLQTALAAGKPGIRVVSVPGVGHDGLVTTPAGSAAIVKSWSIPL
jgi:hypothetical protein